MKSHVFPDRLILCYSPLFKYAAAAVLLVFISVWFLIASAPLRYNMLVLAAIIAASYFAGLCSSKPWLIIGRTGISDFQLKSLKSFKTHAFYKWNDISKIEIISYPRLGYYFVLHFFTYSSTIKFPLSGWNVAGSEIAKYLEWVLIETGDPVELDFNEFYSAVRK